MSHGFPGGGQHSPVPPPPPPSWVTNPGDAPPHPGQPGWQPAPPPPPPTPRAAAGKITAVAGETTLATPPVDRSAAPTKADGYLAALSLDGGPQSPAATEVVTILTGLSGEPAASRPQYDRDAFFERADLNGDCVNTRNEVLRAQALRFEMASSGCVVAKGVWWDAYSGEWFDQPKELQMDHVVALAMPGSRARGDGPTTSAGRSRTAPQT